MELLIGAVFFAVLLAFMLFMVHNAEQMGRIHQELDTLDRYREVIEDYRRYHEAGSTVPFDVHLNSMHFVVYGERL